MFALVLLCFVALVLAEIPAYCPLNWPTNTTVHKQRRLTVDEWKSCGPLALSEFVESNETSSDIALKKRVAVPMRPSTPEEWAACPHKREDAIYWAIKYADINGDGLICWEEVAQLKNDLLNTAEKIYLLFSAPDLIMKHCSGNDGYITELDFDKYKATCLRNCESVMNFFDYFVDRAVAKKNYTPKPVKCSAKLSPEIAQQGRESVQRRQDLYEKAHNKN